jgi:hypothetical protein
MDQPEIRGRMNVPWFESPFFEEELRAARLPSEDEAMVRRFRDDGYLILEEPVTDMDSLDRVTRTLSGKYTGAATGYEEASRIQNAWTFNPHVQELAVLPSVLRVLAVLYRRTPIPFQTLNFDVGTQQMAHSDSIHFNSIPEKFMCGVWIALEDTDADNGPLFYHEGSHSLPVYDFFDLGIPTGYEHYREYEIRVKEILEREKKPRKEFHVKKGQGVIWSANLFHGGSPIRDPKRTRVSQVTHYYFEDCIYYQPGASSPHTGYLQLKRVRNIMDGNLVPHRHMGRDIHALSYLSGAGQTALMATGASVALTTLKKLANRKAWPGWFRGKTGP